MSATHPFILFGVCLVGQEAVGNALARAVGHGGVGDAFGGEFGIGLRPIGSDSTTPAAWAAFHLARDSVNGMVVEFNTGGPYPLLTAIGLSGGQISAAKAAVTAACFPRATHEYGLIGYLAGIGYEIIPVHDS